MPLVASVDYPNKRIYLSVQTADTLLDTIEVYKEVRALRRTTESHRKFKPIIVAGGNVEKIIGQTYTPSYVQLLYGCRIVPYNASHRITLIRDTFTDDGLAGRDCFDRTPLSASVEVDIDVQVDKIEIVKVATGGGASYTLQQISDAVWLRIIEAGFTAEQLMRLKSAIDHGDATGLESNNPTFKSLDGLKDRVVATYVNGTRTILSRDGA